jgi:hypothetical protein
VSDEINTAVEEVVDFAVSFTSLRRTPYGKLHLGRSASDLMHTMGYFCDQVRRYEDPAKKLATMAMAIDYISRNLSTAD